MKLRMLFSALLKLKNLGLLLLFLAITSMSADTISGLLPSDLSRYVSSDTAITYLPAVALYLAFVAKTLLSKDFHDKFNEREKIRQIQDLNYECLRLANEAKRYTNATYLQKLRKVMEDKNDIVNSFFKGEKSYIKEKIVEQTLKLVMSYIKLLVNFCIRSKELKETDVSEVANRINANTRKLSFTKDPRMLEDIKNLIEMDQKIINRLKEEKQDIERISAKLDYMESTVSMFKHQILSSIESEDMLEKLETAVNEAAALDSVLEDRRKNRMRL
ncbi:hypothetical protein CDQ83_13605 [Clostridium thermosuccinogenes]|nr:hypothetical protein CDQ83_13605 [Pseudoclostridium thermosuccinogenes]